jgi:hypothetical protein
MGELQCESDVLPPGEMFDPSFSVDGLKKKFAKILNPNPEKGHVVIG